MKSNVIAALATCLVLTFMASVAWAQQWAEGSKVLRLVERLDRPQDGYCVAVLGIGEGARTDLPLFAHNCSPAIRQDVAMRFVDSGLIRFPAYTLCVTAYGVNGRALPGSSVLLRQCGERSSFLDTEALQRFSQQPDGRLKLADSNLCLTIGGQSTRTYSSNHRWRALYLDDCATTPAEQSRWEFTTLTAK